MQQPLAISNPANNFLSLPDQSLYYEITSIIRYKIIIKVESTFSVFFSIKQAVYGFLQLK